MFQNEAMATALLENTRNSSWRVNHDKAEEADEHFMLVQQGSNYPKLVGRIRERSNDIMKKAEEHQRWSYGE